ncbi:hypothetical protein [Streptomyces sp. NEAU-S77]|uniref:hypothetical protein n=1 Tax=Streptomyces sp. NEAU-S77 TaxID=3411033 RepID=UPI003BA1C96F
MIPIRAARPADAAELVRLRWLMFLAMHGEDEPGSWEASAEEAARRQGRGYARPSPPTTLN